MSITKLLLHVGMCKTGTSSIQATLADSRNRSLLAAEGFYYLDALGINQSTPMYNLFNQGDPMRYAINHTLGYRTEDVQRINEENCCIIANIVSSQSAETLVISAESLSALPEEGLTALRDFFLSLGIQDIRVFQYVRHPIDYHVSFAQTNIRMGFPPNPKRSLIIYQSAIMRMEAVFGKECVSLFSFNEALREYGDPVLHFLFHMGFPRERISLFHIQKTNEALPQEVVEFFLFYNERVPAFLLNEKGRKIGQNPQRGAYNFSPLLFVPGIKYTLPALALKHMAEAVLDDTIWLREHSGIDFVESVRAVIQGKEKPVPSSPPETYDALYNAFLQLDSASRTIFLEFLEGKRGVSQTWEKLYWRCFFQNTYACLTLPKKASLRSRLCNRNRYSVGNLSERRNIAQVYYGKTRDLSESHSLVFDIRENLLTIDHTFETGQESRLIRLDPADFACCFFLQKLSFDVPYKIISGNWAYRQGDMFLFLTDDPQIYIRTKVPVRHIHLKCYIDTFLSPFQFVSARDFLKILGTR